MSNGPALLRDYVKADELEAALAEYVGVQPEQVLATTGGDDAIDRILRHHLAPGEELIVPVPTFEMIPAFARMADAHLVPVEYEWGAFPVDEILGRVTSKTRVVVAISPDNPTGAAASAQALTDLANALPASALLLVDQAYIEFADEDPTSALLALPNVLVVRTLSKAWGLAGLRVGYLVGPADRVRALRQVGGPYAVSGIGASVALQRLRSGKARMWEFVAENKDRRERLTRLLAGLGGVVQPSQANFVLVRLAGAADVRQALESAGVLTRYFPALVDYLRITVPRSEQEFQRLAEALRTVLRPPALLFDMDGVLADVSGSYRVAIQETCASYGVQVSGSDIARAKAGDNVNDDWALTRALLLAAGAEAPLDEVTMRFEERYQGTPDSPGLWRNERLIPDKERLTALSKECPLGVVTGRPRQDAERFLQEEGIRDLFSVLVCREDAPLKPNPRPVSLAMEKLGVHTAWFLGDTPDDIVAAQGAGALPVGVLAPGAGSEEREALEGAGAVQVLPADKDLGGLLI
ncbi:MAG: aminotransferase class I/II-fold pyridoxal phosphate-dependent enzyme [Longimicrobiales bacterium]